MAVSGPKPKEQRVSRTPLTHDWVDVIDKPYRGARPALPRGTSQQTRAWWDAVTRLPHCVLWGEGDWQFALDTARIHAAFVAGDLVRASELRIREARMGTTLEAVRDLRIRYVQPEESAPKKAKADSPVTSFEDERRKRLTGTKPGG